MTTENDVLTIRTEWKSSSKDGSEGERVLFHGRMYGSRGRRVSLPKDAVSEAATSEITEGILTVTVPRRPQDAEGESRTEEGIRSEVIIPTEEPLGKFEADTEMGEGERAEETV